MTQDKNFDSVGVDSEFALGDRAVEEIDDVYVDGDRDTNFDFTHDVNSKYDYYEIDMWLNSGGSGTVVSLQVDGVTDYDYTMLTDTGVSEFTAQSSVSIVENANEAVFAKVYVGAGNTVEGVGSAGGFNGPPIGAKVNAHSANRLDTAVVNSSTGGVSTISVFSSGNCSCRLSFKGVRMG